MKKLFVFTGVFLFTVLCVRASVAQRSFQIDVAPSLEQLSNPGLLIMNNEDLLLPLIESFQQMNSVGNLSPNLRPYEHNGFPLPAINTDKDPGIIFHFFDQVPYSADPSIVFHFDQNGNRVMDRMPTFGTYDPHVIWPYVNYKTLLQLETNPLLDRMKLRSNGKLDVPR